MIKVLNLAPSPLSKTKIHVSHTNIPDSYLDPTQPPTKRGPFHQVRDADFIKSTRLCLPTNLYNAFYNPTHASGQSSKPTELPTTNFSKVIMTLHDILQDSSFRTGNFTMLAQPHPPSPAAPAMPSSNSTVMYINRGRLTIEMPYSVSQRSGLGAAFRVTQLSGGGRKHEKSSARYRVSIDLRQPNMVKGKSAFDRLVWASREVEGLREGRLWLLTDSEAAWYKERRMSRKRKRNDDEKTGTMESLSDSTAGTPRAEPSYLKHVRRHHPTTVDLKPKITSTTAILVPTIVHDSSCLASLETRTATTAPKGSGPNILEEDIHDLIEYLGLLFLKSKRITSEGYGKSDPYLCRYTLPTTSQRNYDTPITQAQTDEARQANDAGNIETSNVEDTPIPEDLTLIEYSGLIPSDFVLQLVVDLIRKSRSELPDRLPDQDPIWAALQVRAHPLEVQGGTDGYTILLQAQSNSEKQITLAEDQATSTQAMEIDQREEKQKVLNSRRFKFATCFEFVDSIVQ